MQGISNSAAGGVANKKKYNGIDHQDDLGLNEYDAFFRDLDPQTGRWWQVDPVTDGYENLSPYASMYNDPLKYSDPLGDEGETCCLEELKAASNFISGAVIGSVVGTIDNVTGSNLRGQLSSAFAGTGAAGYGYNTGLGVADAGSIVFGMAATVTGGSAAGGGTLLTIGSGGVASPVSVPVAAGGVALTAVGISTITNGVKNLVNQNGRVEASSNNPTGSDGPSSKPKNAPQQQGTPKSSKIEAKDASGKTTKYSTYGSDGNIKKQVQVDQGSSRHGINGATKKVPNYNTNPQTGEKHMNGYKIKKAMPAETPPGSVL